MRNNRSRRSTLSAAILWTLVAFVWGVVTVTRYNDPTTVGDSLVLTIFHREKNQRCCLLL